MKQKYNQIWYRTSEKMLLWKRCVYLFSMKDKNMFNIYINVCTNFSSTALNLHTRRAQKGNKQAPNSKQHLLLHLSASSKEKHRHRIKLLFYTWLTVHLADSSLCNNCVVLTKRLEKYVRLHMEMQVLQSAHQKCNIYTQFCSILLIIVILCEHSCNALRCKITNEDSFLDPTFIGHSRH